MILLFFDLPYYVISSGSILTIRFRITNFFFFQGQGHNNFVQFLQLLLTGSIIVIFGMGEALEATHHMTIIVFFRKAKGEGHSDFGRYSFPYFGIRTEPTDTIMLYAKGLEYVIIINFCV